MFAGFDNIDTSNVAFVGALGRVRPETVRDLEVGTTYHSPVVDLQANVYSMWFHDEIAPIGALSYIGTPLRKNVGSSYRRGLEADATIRATPRLELGATLAASSNRIREYVDSTGSAPATHRDVEPLLTPRLLTSARARFAATSAIDVGAEGRYQSRAFLQNTSDARFVLPAASNLDASVAWHSANRRQTVTLRAGNLANARTFASGYASGGESYYYVVPPRNVFITATLVF
jgi:iron complex outermembrane receptor protein